jgi:hypothetical protein
MHLLLLIVDQVRSSRGARDIGYYHVIRDENVSSEMCTFILGSFNANHVIVGYRIIFFHFNFLES